jgi:hypothetical protein
MDIISPSVTPKIINNAVTTAAVVGATLVGVAPAAATPNVLVVGANTITVTVAGNFVITLPTGCNGTAVSGVGGAVVTGTPVTLVPGVNTITVAMGGTNLFTVNLIVDNNLVTIPPIQTGYVTRLAVSNPTGGTANLMVQDVYTPDASNGNPTPTLQVKDRYPIIIISGDWIDINGHKISKHMGLLRVTSDTAGIKLGYVLELE